ncbi:MAG: Fur family transcriptional regulator [Anaerotignum sp.]|nr:Fur family transcriptional regulator [Anaerotignum sp.]
MERNQYREIFNQNNIKTTKQRETVFDVLMNASMPLTVEEIYVTLREKEKNMSLSTIYRVLDVFVSKDLVEKSNFSKSNMAVYEIKGTKHKHHLICICCGKIVALDSCPIHDYEKALEKTTSFDIISHKLEFFGYCPECKIKFEGNA